MNAILFTALATLSLSFVNSLVVIAAIVVAATLIVAYMATAYKAPITIEWEAPEVAIERPEFEFLKAIKRCKDGVYMVSFEACGKTYHRRMPMSARTGKGGYAAFIKTRYAHLFIEAEATIEEVAEAEAEATIEEVAEPLSIGVKTPSIDSWEAMEKAIEQGYTSGKGWTTKGNFVKRYRGDGSYVKFLRIAGSLRFISDHEAKCYDTGGWAIN